MLVLYMVKKINIILIGLWSLFSIAGLGFVFLGAWKTRKELIVNAWGIPEKFQWNNFTRVWESNNFGLFFFNSIIVVVSAVILTLVVATGAAYVLSRINFKISKFLFAYFIIGMSIPIPLLYIPLYVIMAFLGLSDTHLGLIIAYTAASIPVSVYLLTGSFSTIPVSIAESSVIDGCNSWTSFIKVMLPIAKPGLFICALLNFIWLWKEYQLSLILLTSEDKFPLQLGIYAFQNAMQYTGDWPGLFAGITIVTVPTIVVFIILSRMIMAGMTAGAVK